MPSPRFDVASALDLGSRDTQEDALITDFPVGDDCGCVILSDGMGGHTAGDVASNIVVTEVFSDLKFHRPGLEGYAAELPSIMAQAAREANKTLGEFVLSHPGSYGMGATLLAAAMVGPDLYWASVGDSPLYLFRGGELRRLNSDHSMAPQIDLMAAMGMLTADAARLHPDRNMLISAIFGGDIVKMDVPETAFPMQTGDIVIAASDGLQSLSDAAIRDLLDNHSEETSAGIAQALLQALKERSDPDQDNISFAVIKVNRDAPLKTCETEEDAAADPSAFVPTAPVEPLGGPVANLFDCEDTSPKAARAVRARPRPDFEAGDTVLVLRNIFTG